MRIEETGRFQVMVCTSMARSTSQLSGRGRIAIELFDSNRGKGQLDEVASYSMRGGMEFSRG